MKDLNSLRKKIDTLDSEILKALSKRAKIAIEIGEIKKENKEKNNLFRPERQAFILKRLFQNNEKYAWWTLRAYMDQFENLDLHCGCQVKDLSKNKGPGLWKPQT